MYVTAMDVTAVDANVTAMDAIAKGHRSEPPVKGMNSDHRAPSIANNRGTPENPNSPSLRDLRKFPCAMGSKPGEALAQRQPKNSAKPQTAAQHPDPPPPRKPRAPGTRKVSQVIPRPGPYKNQVRPGTWGPFPGQIWRPTRVPLSRYLGPRSGRRLRCSQYLGPAVFLIVGVAVAEAIGGETSPVATEQLPLRRPVSFWCQKGSSKNSFSGHYGLEPTV
jgi:hypothetical protein